MGRVAAEMFRDQKEMPMPTRTAILASLAFILVSTAVMPAFAQSSQCTQTFCVSFPADWEARVRGGMLLLTDPTNSIRFELRSVTQLAQFQQARAEYERDLTARATNLAWETEPTPAQQHGMAGLVRRGRGTLDGRPMRFFMLGLAGGNGGVVGAGVITGGAPQAQVNTLIEVLNTIRPAA
jgi:hypothetical protein